MTGPAAYRAPVQPWTPAEAEAAATAVRAAAMFVLAVLSALPDTEDGRDWRMLLSVIGADQYILSTALVMTAIAHAR